MCIVPDRVRSSICILLAIATYCCALVRARQLGWIREDALPVLLLVTTSITFPAAAFTSLSYYLPFVDSTSASIFLVAGFTAAVVPSAAVWLAMASRAGPRCVCMCAEFIENIYWYCVMDLD